MTVNTIKLAKISDYLGTVEYGKIAGSNINELWEHSHQIVCDFENVHGMTGDFADEAFGKLFKVKGSREYIDKMRFHNLNELVEVILKSTLFRRYKEMNSRDGGNF